MGMVTARMGDQGVTTAVMAIIVGATMATTVEIGTVAMAVEVVEGVKEEKWRIQKCRQWVTGILSTFYWS